MKSKEDIYQDETLKSLALNPAGIRMDIIFAAMDEYAKQEAITYEAWKSKLTPTQLCAVHPPVGSGSGIGLYHKTDDDLWNLYLESKKQKV